MEPTALVQWLILGGTLASVALPFAYPVLPDRHGGKFISVSLVGPVGWRYRIGAAVFLALILLGLYAAFVRGALHLTMLMIAPGLILLSLLPLLPEAIIRRFLIPAGRIYLVVLGIAFAVKTTLALWDTAFSREISVRWRRNVLVWRLETDPGMFWFSVTCAALLNFVAVRLLREWFVLRQRSRTPAR